MTTFRANLSFQYDSALPRDAISINPHYSGDDAQSLANALSANLKAYTATAIKPWTIKIYDAEKAPPSYPLATASQSGATPNTPMPREVALCLSYYSGYNRPRFRGRLFLPYWWFSATASTLRPPDTAQQEAINFAKTVLAGGLPSQTVWCVYSKTEHKMQGAVNHVWVDDEFDTMRSRGLKPTARTSATIP